MTVNHLPRGLFTGQFVTGNGKTHLFLSLLLLGASATGSVAQELPFPQPVPTTAFAAAAGFDDRAAAVIRANACGREDDYLGIRDEMRRGIFDSQGEDLSHILVAKMAFIARSAAKKSVLPCVTKVRRMLKEIGEHARLVTVLGPSLACSTEVGLDPNGAAHAETRPIEFQVTTSLQCMSAQVNDAIKAMKKTTQMGSSDLPCITKLQFASEGEFDVNVRELVRMLYLSGQLGPRQGGILAPSTIDYMYDHLLAASGKLSDASYPTVMGCGEPAGDTLGSPEDRADGDPWYEDLVDGLGDLFEWALITYITYGLVPGGGGILMAAPFLLTAAGGGPAEAILSPWNVRIPESENHRLMIETSKFLTNADIIARLDAESYDTVGNVRDAQEGVRAWLMERMGDIAQNDFQEYNARPYSRYSLNAILNLHDFAALHGDKDLAEAARVVLDLSEAKFAATSNRGRRIVPFRRLSDGDGDEKSYLYQSISGADHAVTRAMLLSGQTQTLDPTGGQKHGDGIVPPMEPYQIGLATLAEMVNPATSSYRLPHPVLIAAVERQTFEQTVRHTGVERVEQSPAFTISAGGVRTPPTSTVASFGFNKDRGVAMPTVIIPTIAGTHMEDLFRFEGIGTHHERTGNTCVAPGVACGWQPKMSAAFERCTKRQVQPFATTFFVSSAECFPTSPGPHFYLAGRINECREAGCISQWGIMEIVDASPPALAGVPPQRPPDPAYNAFQVGRSAAFNLVNLNGIGRADYVTSDGRRITFGVAETNAVGDGGGNPGTAHEAAIISINGHAPPEWRTLGGVIDTEPGKTTIKGSIGTFMIDLSDPSKPKRIP